MDEQHQSDLPPDEPTEQPESTSPPTGPSPPEPTDASGALAFLDAPPGPAMSPSPQEAQLGAVAHLLGLISFLMIPGFLGPLVLWLIKKDQSAFISDQGKEALNFQLTWFIAAIPLSILVFIIMPFTCGLSGLALLAFGVMLILAMVRAAMVSGKGVSYRYKYTLRLIN